MGRLFGAVDDGGFDRLKSGLFQPLAELDFGKAQPGVGVEFARLFEIVLHEIKDHDAPARTDDAECLADGTFGFFGVV